jgi:hypothetical protein
MPVILPIWDSLPLQEKQDRKGIRQMSGKQPGDRSIGRRELYELVWSEPMKTLAARKELAAVPHKNPSFDNRMPSGEFATTAIQASPQTGALPTKTPHGRREYHPNIVPEE